MVSLPGPSIGDRFQPLWNRILQKTPDVVDDTEIELLRRLGLHWEASHIVLFSDMVSLKEHERCYPMIAKVAKEILCIPATSAGAERDFSYVGIIMSAKRSRLLPENVNKLVFIHQNKHLFLLGEN